MALTEREIATLIIIAALLTWGLCLPKVRSGLWMVVRTFFSGKLWVPLVIYLAYASGWVALAWWTELWSWGMLKDTIIVTVTIAIPLLYRSITAPDGSTILRRLARDVIGVGAVVLLYVNLASFYWWIELILQLLVIFLAMLSAVTRHQGGRSLVVARIADVIIGIVSVAMIVWTSIWLAQNAGTVDWLLFGMTFAMSLWLPLVLLPFAYVFGFYAAVEGIFVRLPFFNGRKQKPLRVRIAILIGLRGSIRYAKAFIGPWLQASVSLAGWRDTLQFMTRLRVETGRTPRSTGP